MFSDLRKLRGRGKAHGNWRCPQGSLVEDATKRLDTVIEAINSLVKTFQPSCQSK